MSAMSIRGYLLLLWVSLACQAAGAQEAVERHLPSDGPFLQWAQDPELLASEAGDRLEQREVLAEQVETVKLKNVVPPIRFESGVAEIPPSYI